MTTKKFWCHYIGSDGKTPKRRNIELTDINELLPTISNEGAKTPLWYEREEDYYILYAQLSDKVAVAIQTLYTISDRMLQEYLLKTDEDIDREYEEQMAVTYSEESMKYHPMTPEKVAECKASWRQTYDDKKKYRDDRFAMIRSYQDFDNYLLDGAWISGATLRAYQEAESGIWPVLEHLRNQALEKRQAEARAEQERRRKEREEEARKQAAERAADDAKIQRLVELGVLPDKPLTKMQRGTALIALQQRYNVLLKDGSRFIGTLYDVIDKHGFTEVHRQAKVWNKYGDRIAKPKREYFIFPPDGNTGTSIDGHFGALCVIDQKHDTEY